MKICQWPRTASQLDDRDSTKRAGLQASPEEDDPEFHDFIESISLSGDELAVFVANPELTISDIRRYFRHRDHRVDQG